MFSTELTKLSFGDVFTNSFNTAVTGSSGGVGSSGGPAVTTTDIMRTGISNNNNVNTITITICQMTS